MSRPNNVIGFGANQEPRSPSILPGASVNQLQSGAEVLQTTKEFLSSCPSTRYVIISQTDVHAEDFAGRAAVPVLRREMASEKVKTRMSVREVIKENTEHMVSDELLEYMISHCNAVLITVDTSGRQATVRQEQSIEADFFRPHHQCPYGWYAQGQTIVDPCGIPIASNIKGRTEGSNRRQW